MSETLSQRSGGSGRRYKSVNRGSSVDDSLFAGPKKGERKRIPPNACVITAAELEKIKSRATFKSDEEIRREKEANDHVLQEKKKAAKLRKAKMIQLEAEAKKKIKKTDIEIENLAREETIRNLAQDKLEKNNDLVKTLTALGARAEAFTIRDMQRNDKDIAEQKEREYNEHMDMLMEIDRLKDLQRREEEDAAKLVKRHQNREIMMAQMEDKRRRKIIAEEAREQENQAMLALIKKYEEDDYQASLRRKEEIRLAKIEIKNANENAIAAKQAIKDREKEEVRMILEYQAKKDAELRAREMEEEEKAKAMKERQAKLLEQQEKSQNKQAEIDELRARRAAEEKERIARTRELEEAEKRRNDMIELKEARRIQAEQKKSLLSREAGLQQKEYEAAVQYNIRIAEREKAEADKKKRLALEHREAIMSQIAEAEDKRRRSRNEKYEEGRKLKQEFAAERAKLETIRDHMVSEMRKKGVSDKYLTEMVSADIQKLQMR